uniref:Uncharacterized mitochondrial protein AtMg00810-like n=1 Tax=Nicotiana tabacum TaxID=4097 RepID=A0A1S3YD44_TOBAC|nr:PREDICTED: uncharacterized mitochondrial protein AtMg00810-like [Nicotiana tabacum]
MTRASPLANTNESTTPDLDTLVAPNDSSLASTLPAPVMPSSDAVTPPISIHKGQGLLYEDKGNKNIIGYSDADWAGSPSDKRFTSGYYVMMGENLISWKSKKQDVIARSSAKAKYRAMTLVTCELTWLK